MSRVVAPLNTTGDDAMPDVDNDDVDVDAAAAAGTFVGVAVADVAVEDGNDAFGVIDAEDLVE